MSAPSVNPELVTALKRLRLGGLLPALGERLSLCEKQNLPYPDVLLMLVSDEISRRDGGAAERRAQQAGLSCDMVLSRWDASAKVTYDRRLMQELCSLRFVADHRNVAILGQVGVGKTFWGQALSHLCCQAGYHVRFSRADALLRSLRQSRMDNSREALMTALSTVDVLVLDDFALEPMGRDESRDIYQLFVERNGRFSTIATPLTLSSKASPTVRDKSLSSTGWGLRLRLRSQKSPSTRAKNPHRATKPALPRRPPCRGPPIPFPLQNTVGIQPYGFSMSSPGPIILAIDGPMGVAIGKTHL